MSLVYAMYLSFTLVQIQKNGLLPSQRFEVLEE